jgi:cytochrome b
MSASEESVVRVAVGGAPTAVRIWDPLVRVLHWGLALSIAVAWLTYEGGGASARIHEAAGYVALAFIGTRVIWGVIAPSEHARFASFLCSPQKTWAYARSVAAGCESRYLGHNPLGAWMIVALLVTAAIAAGSGWLYITDAYWGVPWVEALHEGSAILLLVLIGLHVVGVIFTSRRHRENLVAAMIHGRKAPADATPHRGAKS